MCNISYILIAVYFLVSIPAVFGYTPLIVASGSMEPNYKVGSVLYYKEVDVRDIKVNDVITFMTVTDSNVTHRVDEIVEGGFVTKGDANLSPDAEVVTFDKVKGKVLDFNIPIVGYYIGFVNKNLYLVGVVVIILLSEFLLENVKNFKIKKSKKGVENI